MKSWKIAILVLLAAALGWTLAVVGGGPKPAQGVAGQEDFHAPGDELTVSDPTRKALLLRARQRWDGKDPAGPAAQVPGGDIAAPLILTVFHADGRLLTWRRESDTSTDLATKVDGLIRTARAEVGDAVANDVYLHLEVITYNGRFPNFGVKGIFRNRVYEPRVTGLVVELNGAREEVPPLVAQAKNLGPKGVRKLISGRLGIKPAQFPNLSELWLEIYRTVHFGERSPDRAFGNFFRSAEWFTHEDVTDQRVLERLELIGRWYGNNVHDGEVTYKFDPSSGNGRGRTLNKTRTMVRSTMAVWILNRLAVHLDDPKLLALGEETMRHYFERYFRMGESLKAGVILPSEEKTVKGELSPDRWTTAGFLCAAALERPPEDRKRFTRECELLMSWMMERGRDDGVFWVPWGHSQYFMPGQAMLTLAYAWEETGDQRYGDFLHKTWDAYERPLFDMMHLGDKRYAPYAPAWFTQPAAKMWEIEKARAAPDSAERMARLKRMVFTINDRVRSWYELNAEAAPYMDQDGIMGPKYGFRGNASITAASLEALIDAAHIADLSGDVARRDDYMFAARRTMAYLFRIQLTPASSYYLREPARSRVLGGFKTDLYNNIVWMDNVWHLTSALIKARQWKLLPGAER